MTCGRQQVQVAGATIGQVANNLEKELPGVKEELSDEDDINAGMALVIDEETAKLGMPERVKELTLAGTILSQSTIVRA